MNVKHDCYERTINLEELTTHEIKLIMAGLMFTGQLTRERAGDYNKLFQEIEEKIQGLGEE